MSARRTHSAAVFTLALVSALLIAPAVLAAAPAKAPQAGGSLDLQAWPDSGNLIVVTAIEVPESTKLPATVRIPVPAGATVQWVGEVLGGDLSADPAREYKLIQSEVGGQYAEFTVEQTRTAQVDAVMSALSVAGASTSASFEWIQSVESPWTSFSIRVPGNAADVKISPTPAGPPDTNDLGERLYSGEQLELAPGAKQAVSFSYRAGAVGSAAAGGSGVSGLVAALAVALAVAVIVLIALVVRQRRAVAPTVPASGRRTTRAAEPSKDAPEDPTSDDDWGFEDLD